MKLTSTPRDRKAHTYCMRCRKETIRATTTSSRLMYDCTSCQYKSTRALIIDPAINWWLADDGEYWHEVAGVFVANKLNEFLFFERLHHPFGLTVPAGHVDRGEKALRTAARELHEEVGLRIPPQAFTKVAVTDITGDECRRGSDAHRWHVFATRKPYGEAARVDGREGIRPVWLSLNEATNRELTPATRNVITTCRAKIVSALY